MYTCMRRIRLQSMACALTMLTFSHLMTYSAPTPSTNDFSRKMFFLWDVDVNCLELSETLYVPYFFSNFLQPRNYTYEFFSCEMHWGPPEIPRTSQYYSTEELEGVPQLGPYYAKERKISRLGIFVSIFTFTLSLCSHFIVLLTFYCFS